jgi:segregation and condensation protein A
MLTEDYRVQLDAFEGPLDLLLYLIRKNEVDLHDIPVATITDQYLGFLKNIERIDIDIAGEFLVMAATLMEIKSRMLSPQAKVESADAEEKSEQTDPRAELVRQLLAYKKYRDAATVLEDRHAEWSKRFGGGAAGVPSVELVVEEEADLDLEDVDLLDLVEAFRQVSESVNFERLGEHQVQYDDTPLELHAEDIVDRLKRETAGGGDLAFASLFTGRTRSEMVGLFLAMLELCRRRAIAFKVDEGQQIRIRLRTEEESAQDASQRAEQEAREEPQESEVVNKRTRQVMPRKE